MVMQSESIVTFRRAKLRSGKVAFCFEMAEQCMGMLWQGVAELCFGMVMNR